MGKKGKSKYIGTFKKGDKYGRYSILNPDVIIEREAKVNCVCECGNKRLVSCYTLIKQTSTQCTECGNSLPKGKNPAWWGYGNIPGKIFSKLKRDALNRGYCFELTIEHISDLYDQQNKKCALSGVELQTTHNNITASLDRVDNNKGYIIGNIQWLHKDINMMKKTYSQEYFINICKLVSEYKETNDS